MSKYTRTIDSTVELPDLGLTVHFGDVVDLPADFFTDSDHATASGFTPVPSTKTTTATAVPAAPALSEGVDHADPK